MAIQEIEQTTIGELEDVKGKLTIVTECSVCEAKLPNPVQVIALDLDGSGNLEIPAIIDSDCENILSAT